MVAILALISSILFTPAFSISFFYETGVRTNELVRWRMHFLSDAIAEIEGLLEVNRDFCKKQMAEKASPALPTNCAVVPKHSQATENNLSGKKIFSFSS